MSQIRKVPGYNLVSINQSGRETLYYEHKEKGVFYGIEEMQDRLASGYRGSPSPPPSINTSRQIEKPERNSQVSRPRNTASQTERQQVQIYRSSSSKKTKQPLLLEGLTSEQWGRGSLFISDMLKLKRNNPDAYRRQMRAVGPRNPPV